MLTVIRGTHQSLRKTSRSCHVAAVGRRRVLSRQVLSACSQVICKRTKPQQCRSMLEGISTEQAVGQKAQKQ